MIAFVLVLLVFSADASIVLTVLDDSRRVMDLGVFAYSDNGVFNLKLSGFSLKQKDLEKTDGPIGFTLDQVPSAVLARQEKNYGKTEEMDKKICFIDDPAVIPVTPPPNWRTVIPLQSMLKIGNLTGDYSLSFSVTNPGLYALFFYNCKQYGGAAQASLVHVSFTVVVEQYNVDPLTQNRNYLGVGMETQSKVYFCFALIYVGVIALWVREWHRNSQHVHKIHYLMSLLILFKTLTVFFQGMKYRSRAMTDVLTAWDVFYYLFLTLKGLFLFSVILLLGSGWSFLKPFLGDRDKKALLLVLPLQVIVNTAIAVIDETSEGNQNWVAWRDMLHILDIVCCCCVLLPVVWSIKSLRDVGELDGKVQRNLQRLRQFRTFYIVVVAYIYFTRIGVVLLENSLSYTLIWVAAFVHEVGSLFFYTYVGTKFRPQERSPYLYLPSEDMEELQDRVELGAGATSTAPVGGATPNRREEEP